VAEPRPALVFVLVALNIVVGLLGLFLCLLAPAPEELAISLGKAIDGAVATLQKRVEDEVRLLKLELEWQQSGVRREELSTRVRELESVHFVKAKEAFAELTSETMGVTYSLLRLAGVLASFLIFSSGFALLAARGQWARRLAIVAGLSGVVVAVALTCANAFLATPAVREGVEVLLANTSVPGLELPHPGLSGAAVSALGFVLSALLGVACLQYPLFLALVCLTEEVREAFAGP